MSGAICRRVDHLFIEWHEGTNRISMTGPALRVFDGTYRPEQ